MSTKRKNGPHFGQRKLHKQEAPSSTCRRCLNRSDDVVLVEVHKANGVDADKWQICRECFERRDHEKWVRRREQDRRIMAERPQPAAERETASAEGVH